MNNFVRTRMIDPPALSALSDDGRRLYEATLTQAMAFAERYLSRDDALEIAHDIAVSMLRLPPERVTGTLIYVAVANHVRRRWRSSNRRRAVEGAYHERWTSTTPSWADPDADLELREMQSRIASVVASMPDGMREVFVLIREEGLTYKDVAARLGIGVGTVHTQLSRATALLRECITQYQSAAPQLGAFKREQRP
jgi:RNA polymerase sigma factor (sigma-70 family)